MTKSPRIKGRLACVDHQTKLSALQTGRIYIPQDRANALKEVALGGWYLTNQGNLCKIVCVDDKARPRACGYMIQRPYGVACFYMSNHDQTEWGIFPDEWLACEAPKSAGRDALVKVLMHHQSWNQEIQMSYRAFLSDMQWAQVWYTPKGTWKKPTKEDFIND